MIKALVLALSLTIPATAFAAGSSDNEPPKSTKTSMECKDGQVWDKETKTCLDSESKLLTDDDRYEAVRELAYAGHLDSAQKVLASMSNQNEDRVLTYYGFTNRKAGNFETAMNYYGKALSANPDNLLARSYMAQGLVEKGQMQEARLQLAEIKARGGANTWPATSLEIAIERGVGFSY